MSFLEGKYVKLVEFFCCDDFTLGLADFNTFFMTMSEVIEELLRRTGPSKA